MNKLLAGFALLLGVFVTQVAVAQDATITGVVVDAQSDEPLPGANVFIPDLGIGAATGPDGRYTITNVTPRQAPYLVRGSFAGYTTREELVTVSAGETVTLNFPLAAGIELEGFVVTALGIERDARSLGYATQRVGGEIIDRAQESNLVNALAGKVAGVHVNSSGGQPGEGSRIVIRGNSSFTGNNEPLFIIDGVPISNDEDINQDASTVFRGGTTNRAVDIDPSTIEDIQVLKGAAAMALYGSRAANGAILITTRGGRAGRAARPQATFNANFRWDDAIIEGIQQTYHLGTQGCFYNGLLLDEGGWIDEQCLIDQGFTPPSATAQNRARTTLNWGPSIDEANANPRILQALGVDRIPTYNPRDQFYQPGATSDYSVSLQGTVAGGNVFASASRLDQEGIVPGTLLDRTSLMARYGIQPLEGMTVETSINYINTQNRRANQGNGQFSYQWTMMQAPITLDLQGQRNLDGTARNYTAGGSNNPFWLAENNFFSSEVDRALGSLHISYRLQPWLTVSSRTGLDNYSDVRKGAFEVGTVGALTGRMHDQYINRREINSDLILQASRHELGPIGVDALLGGNVNHQLYGYTFLQGIALGLPGFFHIGNASTQNLAQYTSERALVGAYSQVTLDYQDWAYLTLTGRNDWSSTLPEGQRSYFYPSASLSVVFTDALDFFQNVQVLDLGKIRGSVARIGNDAPVFSTATTFLQANLTDAVRGVIEFPFQGVNAFRESLVLGNPDLRPELSTEFEVGLELQFADNLFRFDASYYDRTTKDQIFNVPVSAATGFTQRSMNAGELRNQGVELYFGLTPVSTRNLRWNIDANWSRNNSTVVELAEGVDSIFLFGFTDPQIRIMEGENGYGVIWSDRWLRADRELHPNLFAANPNLQEGTFLIGDNGRRIRAPGLGPIGNVQPDWLANIRSSLTFHGVSLSGLVDIRRGGDVLNMDLWYSVFWGNAAITELRGTTHTYEGVNVNTGQPNTVEIVRDQAYWTDANTGFRGAFENFVEDGSFVKLREVTLSYAVPTQIMQRAGAQSATISLTGRNLWTHSDFSYGDPEGSLAGTGNGQGFYHAVTPGTRSFALGLRLGF
jgi:TonB-linked SusC/RagA family outer membrane protein